MRDREKSGDDFYARVYEIVARIPAGRVTTYGAIAKACGMQSARVVGYALMAVPDDMGIPCHRVVNRNGELTGKHHFATPTLMRDLLEEEDVEFDGDRVMMDKYFWDPAGEEDSERGSLKKSPGAHKPSRKNRKR